MATPHSQGAPTRASWVDRVRLSSLATLFVAVVATALMLIAIAKDGVDPRIILLPLALGIWSILDLRR